jgi:hypothetical protein
MLFVKSSFKNLEVFFPFLVPNREWTHMNDDPCKAFKKKKLRQKIEKQKLQFIWTYENMIKFYHSKVPNY